MAKRRSRPSDTKTIWRSDDRPWSDLTEPLLYSILRRVSSNVADFYAFSGVCTAWRSMAKAFKQELFATATPPMFMLRLAKSGALRFQSITEANHHRTSLLQVKTKKCVGVSFGYLIIVDRTWRQPWLVDPFTSTTIRLPKQSFRIRFALLTAPPSSPDCLLLGWGSDLQRNRRETNAVAVCELKGSAGMVEIRHCWLRNAIFRDGKAFVLCEFSGISVMCLVRHPKPRLVEIRLLPVPHRKSYLTLAEAGGDLLLVSEGTGGTILVEARSLDPKKEEGWVRLTSLGGRALLLSYNRCEVSENPSEWEGEDCIFMVSGNTVVRRSLKDASTKVLVQSLPPRHVDFYRNNYGWVPPISN